MCDNSVVMLLAEISEVSEIESIGNAFRLAPYP